MPRSPDELAEFKAHVAERRAQRDANVAAATAAFNLSAAVIVTEEGSEPELFILSGNMGPNHDQHRITFFSKDGPRGHHEGSVPELMDYIARTGTTYQPVGDTEVIAWTSTDEFADGSRRVAYVQALNEASYLAQKTTDHDRKDEIRAAMSKAQSMEDIEAATAVLQRIVHAHTRKNPSLRRVELAQLEAEVKGMMATLRLEPGTIMVWSDAAERRAGKRDFAMVDLRTGDMLFSPRVFALSAEYRTALIAHEIGHLLAWGNWGDDSEDGADRAASAFLGVDITYDKAFGGKGLQRCAGKALIPNPLREKDFDLIPNPTPWVTHLLSAHYTELEDAVPAQWLPRIEKTVAKGTTFTGKLEEFGCGAYGCVLPTLDPKVVLKVTSDESEARFAAELADRLPTPICVAYFMSVYLSGRTRKRSKVYLLWREEAQQVGKIDEVVGQHAEAAIHRQHEAAKKAFIALERQAAARGAAPDKHEIHARLAKWERACEAMAKVPELAFVADGLLRAYREAKIFISDTHGGNLGLCMRNGTPTWVITDPGNVVEL